MGVPRALPIGRCWWHGTPHPACLATTALPACRPARPSSGRKRGAHCARHAAEPSLSRPARLAICPAGRAYAQKDWLLPRIISPFIPVFLLVTVYWSVGDDLDTAHATSIAGRLSGCALLWLGPV